MRVGLVIYRSLDTLTGGYLYDRKLVEHLEAAGDRVEVISLPWRGYSRHLSDNLSRSLRHRLERGGFDVLLQDELNHPSLLVTNRRLALRRRCPIVAVVHVLRSSEHAGSPARRLYAAAERRYLADVDAAVFCCEATRHAAEQLVGRVVPGLTAHPCADHLARPSPAAEIAARTRAPGPLRVLSIANVIPRKGLHVLVDALARLPLDGWRLTIAGSLEMDPAYVRDLRRRIARHDVGANVSLVGAVPNEAVPELLADAHTLVVPSAYEGLAIAYLEAMRFGLPVIASTHGGAAEVIDDGCEGWLVGPGDTPTLAGRLRLLLDDRDLRLAMGLAASRRAASHPTWEESLGRIRAFLCSTVYNHGSPEPATHARPAAAGEEAW